MIISRSIHVAAIGIISFFLWLSNIQYCVCPKMCVHIFFIHLSADRHLGYFHVLTIVNSAAMNIEVLVSFQIIEFSPDTCPRVGLQDHMLALFLGF